MKPCKTIVCVVALGFVASGCASTPSAEADHQSVNGSVELYDGEPEVVFATEFPLESAAEAVARAELALREGNTNLALYMFVRAYDLDNENVYALMQIGRIHTSRGNNVLAVRAYSTVLGIDADNSAALQALGLLYLQGNRHEDALAFLERAVAIDPSLWRAQNAIGIIADVSGDHAAALAAFDKALALRPDDPSILNNRGYSLYMAGKYPEAAQDFAAAAGHGSEKAWLNLGLVRARQGRYDEAVKLMSRIVDREVAYNDVGYVAMRQGDMADAEHFFQEAIRIAPRYFDAAERNLSELRAQQRAEDDGEPLIASIETE